MKRLPTFLPLIGQCLDQQELEREVKQTLLKDQEKNVEGDAENGSEEEGDKEEEEDSGRIVEAKEEERLAERQAEEMDRLLISTLSTLTKLLHECDILQTSEHSTMMCNIWGMFIFFIFFIYITHMSCLSEVCGYIPTLKLYFNSQS